MEKVSIFRKFVQKTEDKPLIDVLEDIKSGIYKDQISAIRELMEEDREKDADALKKQLLSFTTSGTFDNYRKSENLIKYSQYIILDLDKLSDSELERVIPIIRLAPFTYASFVSCRGRGVKFIVRVNSKVEQHKEVYKQVVKYYEQALNVEVDTSGSDYARLCFVSYDEKCYINQNADVFEIEIKTENENKSQKTNTETNISTSEKLEKCLKFTEKKHQYYEGNRNNFVFAFSSNANRFGIYENDTLDFCITNFNLNDKEIKSTVKSAYKNNAHEFAKFAKFANFAEYEKHFSEDKVNIKNKSALSNTPSIPQDVYDKLPVLFQKGIEHIKGEREKDVFLTGALSIISGCLPEVKGLYHGKEVYPNLFSFVLAPPASGKGTLTFSKTLADRYHDEVIALSNKLQENYKQELEAYKHAKKYLKKGEELPPPPVEQPFKVVYIPANTSNAKIIKHLQDNEGFGIICETEADTLGQVFKNDWGSYSDLLRKAYHHEKISISRKTDNEYSEIKEPRLAVVLSGTPNQILNIINSAEDGLFSRFLFYVFSSEPTWLDPSPKSNPVNLSEHFKTLSNYTYEMVNFLENSPTHITLSKKQWERFNPLFDEYLFKAYNLVNQDATSIIKRLGLIVYRFCMIFTALRKYEHKMNETNLECLDQDFNNAIALADIYLEHSLLVYSNLPKQEYSINFKKTSPKFNFFKKLPNKFERKEAIKIGESLEIKERTVDDHLSKLENAGHLSKPKAGYYMKIKK